LTRPGGATQGFPRGIGKRRLLDELQELTGYHRKSLLRLRNRPPILVRVGAVVLTALQLICRQLPFPLRGIDAGNDPV